jgi:biotin synthase
MNKAIVIGINRQEAHDFSKLQGRDLYDLFNSANTVKSKYRGNRVDLCSIVNAKSGACPEDCSFCAQSAHNRTDTEIYSLLSQEKITGAAISARDRGVKRFCIVASGKRSSDKELIEICKVITGLKEIGLFPCATLGMLETEQLHMLKEAGLHRYHHNLETSEAFFSEICTTHTFRDKIRTIEAARSTGFSVCSGGIFGLGESWEDRIEMALALRELGVDSVPINFLTPVKGTPLEDRATMNPLEALKLIAIFRLILPESEIRVCGGRPATLRDMNSFIFFAGADGLLIGNYLTTPGRSPDEDLQMIKDLELEI